MYQLENITSFKIIAIWGVFVFGIALLGLAYAVFLRNQILRKYKGTQEMQQVWSAIRDEANYVAHSGFSTVNSPSKSTEIPLKASSVSAPNFRYLFSIRSVLSVKTSSM